MMTLKTTHSKRKFLRVHLEADLDVDELHGGLRVNAHHKHDHIFKSVVIIRKRVVLDK
jgi:hypothetical protein